MPPEAEVRAFTRCVMELLEVWGKASVRVLDLLPLLRVSLTVGPGPTRPIWLWGWGLWHLRGPGGGLRGTEEGHGRGCCRVWMGFGSRCGETILGRNYIALEGL